MGPEPFFFSLQICEFVQKDELSPAVTQVLWEQATEKVPCSPLERCSSVMLLGMMARRGSHQTGQGVSEKRKVP